MAQALKFEEPLQVLKKIVAHNAQNGDKGQVSVNLLLLSGARVQGMPLRLDGEKRNVVLLGEGNLFFLSVSQLVGIEVLGFEPVLGVLTDGAYVEVPKDGAPAKLELKRKFALVQGKYKDAYGLTLKSGFLERSQSTDASRYVFAQFLVIFDDVLQDIGKDALGKTVLSELGEIGIEQGDEGLKVVRDSGPMVVYNNFKIGLSADTKESLVRMIEQKL